MLLISLRHKNEILLFARLYPNSGCSGQLRDKPREITRGEFWLMKNSQSVFGKLFSVKHSVQAHPSGTSLDSATDTIAKPTMVEIQIASTNFETILVYDTKQILYKVYFSLRLIDFTKWIGNSRWIYCENRSAYIPNLIPENNKT